mmetsp:Transcript_26940/g.83380  ORF Transcript_26940/g.83380 Transcript_26940/m.83380 type:complete len:83 (-) Transcript_26940:512-760(-)
MRVVSHTWLGRRDRRSGPVRKPPCARGGDPLQHVVAQQYIASRAPFLRLRRCAAIFPVAATDTARWLANAFGPRQHVVDCTV